MNIEDQREPLTISEILSLVSQEEIFETFLNIKINLNERYISPFRQDTHPSLTFKYTPPGKLICRDWGIGRTYDCFDAVQEIYLCTLKEAMALVISRFGLAGRKEESVSRPLLSPPAKAPPPKFVELSVVSQNFTDLDIAYLEKHHISHRTAVTYRTASVKVLLINGHPTYIYSEADPAIAFFLGRNAQRQENWKIYFYKRTKQDNGPRFLTNNTRILGLRELPKHGEVLVITKSIKDVMVLHELGVPAIAFASENTMPLPATMAEMKERFKYICTLYDYDKTGIHYAWMIRKLYNVPALFLTDGRFGTENYKNKDISDFIKMNGRWNTIQLLQKGFQELLKREWTVISF